MGHGHRVLLCRCRIEDEHAQKHTGRDPRYTEDERDDIHTGDDRVVRIRPDATHRHGGVEKEGLTFRVAHTFQRGIRDARESGGTVAHIFARRFAAGLRRHVVCNRIRTDLAASCEMTDHHIEMKRDGVGMLKKGTSTVARHDIRMRSRKLGDASEGLSRCGDVVGRCPA